ncbi:MAG: hypothetical protein CSB34_02215 [Desulfobulbus propionicus]|nr:MAG: hypothetical protein CSB34_02215 [Desulfobulbus propionicus]
MQTKIISGLTAMLLLLMSTTIAAAAELIFEGAIIQESYDPSDINLDTISVDYWSFTVENAGTVTIDVLSWERDPNEWFWVDVNGDGEDSFIDSSIHVFQGSLNAANVYVSNDDSLGAGFGDGSIRGNDSYISQEFEAGDYILAISSCGYSPFFTVDEAVAGLNERAIIPYSAGEGDHGDYRITVSGNVSAVPLPAAGWLLAAGVLSLTGMRRKCT